MSHVDALSRKQVAIVVDDKDIDLQLQIAQSRDSYIRELKEKI